MIKQLNYISHNMEVNTLKFILQNGYDDVIQYIIKMFNDNIENIKLVSIHSISIDINDNDKVNEFLLSLNSFDEFKNNMTNMLEYYQSLNIDSNDLNKIIIMSINYELQYIFKNIQLIICEDCDFEYNFIVHNSSCDICKFLLKNHMYDKLKEHFMDDVCDSYLELKNNYEYDNLISNSIKMYNVPIKFKKSISTFYKLILFKFDKHIKKNVKIKFFYSPDELTFIKDELKPIINMIDYDDTCYIKFDFNTYRELILQSILNIDDELLNKLQNIYYKELNNKSCITYISTNNVYDFCMENCIQFILYPDDYGNKQKELYDILHGYFFH